MSSLRAVVFVALSAVGAVFSAAWGVRLRAERGPREDPHRRVGWPTPVQVGVGFLTDFLDTLGVGSFAVTTAIYRLTRMVPDRLLPGTMLLGHALPTVAQAFISVGIIAVDLKTLILLVVAAVVGAWIGAGVVAGWPRRKVQLGMGSALLGAAAVMALRLLGLVPSWGDAIGLTGVRLAAGLAGNFLLGALMTIGIGAYAPSLILFGLLGMSVRSVFPVMMTSCAFIMMVPGLRFVGRGAYAVRPSLGLTLGGVPGVLLAGLVVKELPLAYLSWLVLVVVVYTAAAMLISASKTYDTTDASASVSEETR